MGKPKSVNKNNRYGFEGDPWVEDAVEAAIRDFQPQLFVETGTRLGATTRRIAALLKMNLGKDGWKMFSSDLDREALDIAIPSVEAAAVRMNVARNVHVMRCCSADMIRMVTHGLSMVRAVFYLDAHWGRVVIHRELDSIYSAVKAEQISPPVIFVHDFHVPGEGMKFERVGKAPLGEGLLKEGLDAIYKHSGGYLHNHNSAKYCGGQNCGVGVFWPKSNDAPLLRSAFGAKSIRGEQIGDMVTFEELLEPLEEKVSHQDATSGLRIPRVHDYSSSRVALQE